MYISYETFCKAQKNLEEIREQCNRDSKNHNVNLTLNGQKSAIDKLKSEKEAAENRIKIIGIAYMLT